MGGCDHRTQCTHLWPLRHAPPPPPFPRVELVNTGAAPISLAGFVLSNSGCVFREAYSAPYVADLSGCGTLGPGQYLLVCKALTQGNCSFTFDLDANGDEVNVRWLRRTRSAGPIAPAFRAPLHGDPLMQVGQRGGARDASPVTALAAAHSSQAEEQPSRVRTSNSSYTTTFDCLTVRRD